MHHMLKWLKVVCFFLFPSCHIFTENDFFYQLLKQLILIRATHTHFYILLTVEIADLQMVCWWHFENIFIMSCDQTKLTNKNADLYLTRWLTTSHCNLDQNHFYCTRWSMRAILCWRLCTHHIMWLSKMDQWFASTSQGALHSLQYMYLDF